MNKNKCTICGHTKESSQFYSDSKHCKSCHAEMGKRWKLKNIEKIKQYNRNYAKMWRLKNPERHSSNRRHYYEKLKLEVFEHYSNNSTICICCGEGDIRFLTIDHTNQDGAQHRRMLMTERRSSPQSTRGDMSGRRFYEWLRNNNFPAIALQIMCYNCNCGREYNRGICPHKDKTK